MKLEKKCTKCGESKELSLFNKDSSKEGGYHPWCKACKSHNNRERYLSNTKSLLQQSKNYREAHKDYYHEKCKEHYKQNRDKILDRERNCSSERREEKNKIKKKSDKKNKEKIAARQRERYARHRQRVHTYFGGTCACCFVEDECTAMFHCHHTDSNNKRDTVSNLWNRNWKNTILPELQKCVYVCANCHAKIHAGVINIKQKAEVKDGTV